MFDDPGNLSNINPVIFTYANFLFSWDDSHRLSFLLAWFLRDYILQSMLWIFAAFPLAWFMHIFQYLYHHYLRDGLNSCNRLIETYVFKLIRRYKITCGINVSVNRRNPLITDDHTTHWDKSINLGCIYLLSRLCVKRLFVHTEHYISRVCQFNFR